MKLGSWSPSSCWGGGRGAGPYSTVRGTQAPDGRLQQNVTSSGGGQDPLVPGGGGERDMDRAALASAHSQPRAKAIKAS